MPSALGPLQPQAFFVPRSQSANWQSYGQGFSATLFPGGAAPTLIDSYSETNRNVDELIDAAAVNNSGFGQTFTATGVTLGSCKFFLSKVGSPTGNAQATLYSMSGAFGSTGTPNILLATGDNFDVSTLTSTQTLVTLTFSGVNQFSLVNGTKYCICFEYSGGSSGNSVQLGVDSTAPTHPGNSVFRDSGHPSWSSLSSEDICFYVYSTGSASVTATFTKLPQKALSATESFVGVLANGTAKTLAATLSFVGNLARKSTRALTATLSFIGTFAKTYIPFGGTTFTQSLTATLSFVGFSARRFGFLRTNFTATLFPGSGGGSGVIDSYSETNQDSISGSLSTGGFTTRWAQCFTGNGSKIVDSKWYVQKHSVPTGNAVSKIYAMSGTFGTSGIATGSPLATSDNVDVSTITSLALVTFPFSGANQYVTTNGTNYVVSIEFTGGDASNYLELGYDGSSATHAGNVTYWDGSAWQAIGSAIDFCFYVDGVSGTSAATLTRKALKALSAGLSFVGTFSKSFISGAGTLYTKAFNAIMFQSLSVPFTDSFNRANGSLGSNWTSPVGSFGSGLTGAEGTLHIVSNQVATVTDDTHCYALWNGAFGDDQYAQIKVDQIGAWTGACVRTTFGVDKFYFAFSFAANDYRLYQRWNGAYVSLTPETAVTWSAGDILRLEISGSVHPFSLRMYRNGALVAQWTSPDSTYELTGGSPGMGIYSPAGLNLTLDDWEGGSYSPLHVSDSFNRADGALGANWSATVASQTTIVVSSNTAGVSAHDLHGAYFWSANAFADNQYAQFRWSVNAAYSGAILRADSVNDQYYLGAVNDSATVTIYARWSGSYVSLATRTSLSLTSGDMIRLEVTGSVHPITITMYQNGNPILTWTSPNSTNVRAGGSPGMGIYSPTGSTVVLDDWEGGNLAAIGGPSATLTKQTGKALSAVLSFIGNLAKRTAHGLSATLSFIGTFSKTFIAGGGNLFFQSYAATLSFTGLAVKLPQKALSATLSASASLVRRITRSLSATLSFTGSMVKAIRNAGFTATLSFVGSLTTAAVHFFTKSFAATLSFAGNLATLAVHFFTRSFTATLAFTGTFRRITAKVFVATLSFSTRFARTIRKGFAAILHFSAFFFKGGAVTVLAGWITKAFATINLAGSSARATKAGSQLSVQKSSVTTGSQLTVTRKQ